jgi:hypothetical protein
MASNKAEAAKSTAAMVDGGAKTNPANGSVTNSTEGATAVATDGKSGTKGADLEVKKDADNGPVAQSALSKTSSIVDELRKAASADETPAPAVEENAATKLLKKALAKDAPSPFEALVGKFMQKRAADAPPAPAADPAAGAPADAGAPPAPKGDDKGGDAGVDQLMQAIQSGQLTEEDAEKLLMEGVQSGAITEQDLMEAMQALHGQGGDAAAGAGAPPAGDPAAGGAPAPAPMDPAAGAAAAPAGPDAGMVNDPALEAKMAHADIGPEDPRYLSKLASLYPEEIEAGYAAFLKLAEDMVAEDPAAGADAGAPPAPPAPANDPAAGAAPAGGAPLDPAQMSDPAAAIAPQDDAQKQALTQILAEMHITPEQAVQLLSTQVPPAPAGDPAAMKTAEYRVRVRSLLLNKVAALQEAACTTPKTK